MVNLFKPAFVAIRCMVLFAAAPAVLSQESAQLDYTHEYTFNQARAVVVDSDVASHKAGLTRFKRGTASPNPEWRLGRGTDTTGALPGLGSLNSTDGWAVTVPVQVSNDDLVFIGTNDEYYAHDGEAGGYVHLVHADASSLNPDDPDVVASLYLGSPIHTLASMVDGNDVILLIGTECREDSGDPASLIRMEFPGAATTLPTSFPSSSSWDTWPPTSWVTPPFIRDIVIDEAAKEAYVAAFSAGVFKLDISSGLVEPQDYWPINAHHGTYTNFSALGFSDGALGKLLVVGMSPRHEVESTVWGECTAFTPCDGEAANSADQFGLRLYDVSGFEPVELADVINGAGSQQPTMPLGIATYEVAGPELVIASAALQKGLVVGSYKPGPARINEGGSWGIADGVPIGQFDDILQLGNTLFVASENSLVAFDITPSAGGGPSPNWFDEPVDVRAGTAVVLAGVLEDENYPTLVFASSLANGVAVYQVTGDGPSTVIESKGTFEATTPEPRPLMRFTGRTYSVAALPASETPDGHPWIIAINEFDTATNQNPQTCGDVTNGSVRVYRVETDINGDVSPDTIFEFTNGQAPPNNGPGGYVVEACESPVGALVGGVAEVDGDDLHIYVGYSPNLYDDDPDDPLSEPDAGLLFLTLTYDSVTESLGLTSVAKVPAFPDGVTARSALVELGPGSGVVSAALGCNGVASFLTSGSLLSKYPSTGLSPSAFMDVEPGGDGNLYTTTMDGRLWAFDPSSMATPLGIYETTGQAAFLEGTVSTLTGSPAPPAFFLSDFRTGIHRIQFLSVPGS